MSVFLDTSGLLVVVNRRDGLHSQAARLWDDLGRRRRPMLTTSLVLIECGDGLSGVRLRPLAVRRRTALLGTENIEVLAVTAEVEARAWSLFENRPDKEWGVTDCVSFVIMGDRGVADAFTADRHFGQAGFRALLAS